MTGGVEFNLGEKIRKLRLDRNLTLTEVARITGFSKALISRVEHNLVSPPISTLYRIGRSLNVRMRDFFDEEPLGGEIHLVRAGDRPRAQRDGTRYGYQYASLAADPSLEDFEPLLVTLQPEGRERAHYFTHRGHEFILVLKGRMSLRYGDRVILLRPGDSVFFSARVPHSGACAGKIPVTALSIRYTAAGGSKL